MMGMKKKLKYVEVKHGTESSSTMDDEIAMELEKLEKFTVCKSQPPKMKVISRNAKK